MPAHPQASYVIIAKIGGNEYRAYITHFHLSWIDPLFREPGDAAWQMEFTYLISKKREKGLIAGWELKPFDEFEFEVQPTNGNKYQYRTGYRGRAKFNSVTEDKELTPSPATFLIDIVSRKVV